MACGWPGQGEAARNPDSSNPDAGPFSSAHWHQPLCESGWPALSWSVQVPAKGDRDTLSPGDSSLHGSGDVPFYNQVIFSKINCKG